MSYRKLQPNVAAVGEWLTVKHAGPIRDLDPIVGGFWSSAFGYRFGDRELVLRLSDMREGFAADVAAMRFASPELPIPRVLQTGRAFGGYFAISERHHGRFVEEADVRDAEAIGTALARLLAAMRVVPAPAGSAVHWHDDEGNEATTWCEALAAGLEDHPNSRTAGWRVKLARRPKEDALFTECATRVRELLNVCPERRDLVHGDLLHRNVMVADDDPSRVTGVFSWKCSMRGDFLFDVAWCTFWSRWHPAIAGADMWRRTLDASDLAVGDLVDAPLRHHCYELQIAASHFAWNVWLDDEHELGNLARAVGDVLERGPLDI